jgi:cadmium resistance protein CadD (predicted permease)
VIWGALAGAVGLFAVTNVDDVVVLSLLFARGAGERGAARRVVAGQYAGFTAILAVAGAGALGASYLPEGAAAYLGVVPVALGLWEGWRLWRGGWRGGREPAAGPAGLGVVKVALVTFTNGGDNIGVYVPVFAAVGAGGTIVYAAAFLVLVGVWCAAGWFAASRPVVTRVLRRWGRGLLPVVLVVIGVLILAEGGAFGC